MPVESNIRAGALKHSPSARVRYWRVSSSVWNLSQKRNTSSRASILPTEFTNCAVIWALNSYSDEAPLDDMKALPIAF